LNGYFETAANAAFLPKDSRSSEVLLDIFLLEKALYELVYEVNNRPDWLEIPLNGIVGLLNA